MFSILVSELTPQLLAKAEYWRIFATTPEDRQWADVRHRERLTLVCERQVYPLTDVYASHVRCFPVSISPDGTEVRLKMPQMPDEPMIEEWQGFSGAPIKPAQQMPTPVSSTWWCLVVGFRQYREANAPTPEHYPRRTCDGVWVWSTRR